MMSDSLRSSGRLERTPLPAALDIVLLRHVLDDDGDALAAADAGRAEPEAAAAATQLVEEVRGDARARGAQRVAERDGAAVDVGALAVEAQLTLDGDVLRGEGLVDLDEIEVREL